MDRLNMVQEGVQEPCSLPAGTISPDSCVERPPGAGYGPAYIFETGGTQLGHRGLVGRIHDREGFVALHPLAGHERSALCEDRACRHRAMRPSGR